MLFRITPTMANEQMFVQEPGFINEELYFDPEMPSLKQKHLDCEDVLLM